MNQKGISKVLIISLIAVVVLSVIYIVLPKTGEAPVTIETDSISPLPTTDTPVTNTQPTPSKPAQTTTSKPVSNSPAKKVATILFPSGGESLLVGRTYSIRWSDYTSLEPMTIALQTINSDGNSSLKNIAVNVPAAVTGSYPWVVPYEGGDNKYRIQIFPSDKRTLAVSSKDFSISIYDISAINPDPEGAVFPYVVPATGYAPLTAGFSIPEIPGLDYASGEFVYVVDFGDGSYLEPFSKMPPFTLSHTYTQPGTYQAKIIKRTGCARVECTGPSDLVAVLIVRVDKRP